MTAPHHHPQAEILLRYAAGDLTEPMALAVASHMTFCATCRDQVAQAEAIGGALLEDLPGEPRDTSGDDAAQIERVLERAMRQKPAELRRAVAHTLGAPLLPQPLRDYVGDLADVRWSALGPGIHHRVVASHRDGSVARLLRIAPGRSVFEHSHHGDELTLVLQGAYRSGGTRFARGDVEFADETTLHRPVAETDATCICLAVTSAPLRFSALLGRLMQPFLGV